MVGFTHLKLSEIRNDIKYREAVNRVKAEQIRISKEKKERVDIILNAHSRNKLNT